jgi:hypothetical protein
MLMDPSKRSYVNNKLDEDRRKKEKYAVMEKKKRGLVDVSSLFISLQGKTDVHRRLCLQGRKRQKRQK